MTVCICVNNFNHESLSCIYVCLVGPAHSLIILIMSHCINVCLVSSIILFAHSLILITGYDDLLPTARAGVGVGKDRLQLAMRHDSPLRTSFLTLVAATSVFVMIIGWYFFREYGDSSRIRQSTRQEAFQGKSMVRSKLYAPASHSILLVFITNCRSWR